MSKHRKEETRVSAHEPVEKSHKYRNISQVSCILNKYIIYLFRCSFKQVFLRIGDSGSFVPEYLEETCNGCLVRLDAYEPLCFNLLAHFQPNFPPLQIQKVYDYLHCHLHNKYV